MTKLVFYFATCLSLVLPVVTEKGIVAFDDTNVPSTISPEPPIPKQLTKFQSSVEINQPGQGFSTGIKEFYDGEHKRSTIIITEMGKTTIIIHNHVTGEVLDIKESTSHKLPVYKCTVEQLAQDMVLSSFFNPSWLLRQATQSKEVYMPHAKPIRGIPVNHWKADVLINGANFTVDYFYSDARVWLSKYNLYQVPVQVQVMGSSSKIVYDYYDFLDDIPDESVFQTPEGAFCPTRKSSKQIPTISDQVSYRVEFSSPETEVIFSMNVWVDTRNHFVRLDYGKHLDSGDSELLTEVHDFNLDVNYKIDRMSGKCSLLQLSQSNQLEIDIEEKKSGMTNIRMKHPYEMFNFNHDYQYTGQRFFNGILCDIFIAQVLNYKVSGIPFNVTMEYYFTADNWQEVSDKTTDIEMNLPVLLQIKSLDMSFIQTYRYLDFDQGSMYLSAFDVTNCFKEDKLDFQIDFTRPNLFTMEEKDDIQERCHLAIAKACSVTPLRIENAKLHVEDNYLHFVATLVGLPPAYTQFQLDFECIELSQNNKLVYHVYTQEDCAEQCQKESSFVCNAFGYCPAKKLCSLSKNVLDDGRNVPNAACCKHFKRVNSLKHKWLSSEEVWTKLKDAVYQKRIIIEMAQMSIVAVGIRSDVLNGANREIGSPNWQKEFIRLKNHIIEGHDQLIQPGLSVDDCASACYDEENFYCLSFDFCYSNGECRLSQETSIMNPQYLKESSTCDVYTLNYLTWFNKYPGQTILPKLDVAYQKVGTPDQCATLCFNYADLECKSFDYCELIQTCVIGRTHILDVPKSQINTEPMCSHYSIKYLTDFKKTNNKILKLSDDEIISDISEEECAKFCVENENFICKSFDFCTDSKLCMYRSKHYKDVQGNSLQPSVFCNHYARMYLSDGSKFSATHEKYLSTANTGYSSASMGTLGFFMLIIGIGGAFLSVFIFRRHQRLRKDSMSANMMKDCGTPIY